MFISGERLRENKLLLAIFPRHSRRRILTWLALDIILHPSTFFNHINITNIRTFIDFRNKTIFCNVCGKESITVYCLPDLKLAGSSEMSRFRETLSCINCGATMRKRTIAYALLEVANSLLKSSNFRSIEELANSGINIDILDTEDYSPLSLRLSRLSGYITSKYLPEKKMGIKLNENLYNINLESINFDSEKFDIIITSEVMEHVRNDESAHKEIYRCLKVGGFYIFTVPYIDNMKKNRIYVDTSSDEDIFFTEPYYHKDAIKGKILAYRTYGREIQNELADIGFAVKFHLLNVPEKGIYDGDVFVCRKY